MTPVLQERRMSQADREYLERILEESRKESRPSLAKDKYFEIFSAEQILKKYDPNDDEIDSGVVGKGGDGGMDSVYCFIDRVLLREDTSVAQWKKGKGGFPIQLVVIQSRSGTGSFDASAVQAITDSLSELLDVGIPLAKLAAHYNKKLISIVDKFRKSYLDLAKQKPALSITGYYACLGDDVHPDVIHKADRFKEKLAGLFPRALVDFKFIGAQALLDFYAQSPPTQKELMVPKMVPAGDAYVCLVPLTEFYKFITDADDVIATRMFESNVRDYQGNTKVNSQIHGTLMGTPKEEFWWLNNGITVLASDVYAATGERLIVTDAQIVNGLQTSREIYRYVSELKPQKETRNILVRVIKSEDAAARDRIIKATNSQTAIPAPWLYATESTQRKIEDYFVSHGLYYDRRKNFHKNQGKPADRIITIPRLAQAVIAIYLQEPDNARGRPSTVLQKDYKRVFASKYVPDFYLKCALLLINTKAYLFENIVLVTDINNVEFYLAMCVACYLLNTSSPTVDQIAKMPIPNADDKLFKKCLNIITPMYNDAGGDDKAAKGSVMLDQLKEHLRTKFGVIGTVGAH
jgi:AIPR protein